MSAETVWGTANTWTRPTDSTERSMPHAQVPALLSHVLAGTSTTPHSQHGPITAHGTWIQCSHPLLTAHNLLPLPREPLLPP